MLNLSKAVIYTAIVMTGFLQDVSIGPQSIMQKVQSSAVTQTIQPISTEEAKIIASSIVEEITVAKTIKPEVVIASYYGGKNDSRHGRDMANGEPYNENDETTVAHRELPPGTKLTVINPDNQQKLELTVRDLGPFHPGRQLDVSYAAAKKLGFVEEGLGRLYVTKIEVPPGTGITTKQAFALLMSPYSRS